MVSSLDIVTAFHNAFRSDMATIDRAALALAQGDGGQMETFNRVRLFNELLIWHANGEEAAVFPALEAAVPYVAEAYWRDHRRLDVAYEALERAVSAGDRLRMARASAAFRFHLETHLAKEDAHLYPLVAEHVPVSEQNKAGIALAASVPRERFPEAVAWLFPLLVPVDREKVVRTWHTFMPPEVFSGVVPLIQRAVGAEWDALAQRSGL